MSEFRLSFPAWLLAGKSRLSAEDVLTLRRVSFPDGVQASDDADLLLAIHHSSPEKCDEWDAFFIEALTNFIVHHTHPQGSLDDINVAWLTQMLSSDGVVHSPTEFEVLMHVIDLSAHIPPALSALALDQLRHALSDGVGAYRQMRSLDSKAITRHDLQFIEHVLRTAVDAAGINLSPLEIDALMRIDQATVSRPNHPGWVEFRDAVTLMPTGGKPRAPWLRVPDEIFADVEAAA
jgi:hypothetical protein